MEGSRVLSFTSAKTLVKVGFTNPSFPPFQFFNLPYTHLIANSNASSLITNAKQSSLLSPVLAVVESMEKVTDSTFSSSSFSSSSLMPRLDKSGRFCSPRAAREFAILIAYAACLEGCDPLRLFEKRLNAKREPGYEFNKAMLLEYNHLSFGGPPYTTQTEEEEEALLQKNEKESTTEAEVLLAPPKLVYSKLILRLTKKMLVAVVDAWDKHSLVIDKIAPPSWKFEPGSRILELCILRLAMAEITEMGTRHQIVINEAVHLAKRFCDGTAPRIINGCLRTFVQNHSGTNVVPPSEIKP